MSGDEAHGYSIEGGGEDAPGEVDGGSAIASERRRHSRNDVAEARCAYPSMRFSDEKKAAVEMAVK